jgi:hypothetical protein
MGAGGVPIAVPVSWSQLVYPNWKKLFFMMMVMASMIDGSSISKANWTLMSKKATLGGIDMENTNSVEPL